MPDCLIFYNKIQTKLL